MKHILMFWALLLAAVVMWGAGCSSSETRTVPYPKDMPSSCNYHAECPAGYICDTSEHKCIPHPLLGSCECSNNADCMANFVCKDCFCVPETITTDGDVDFDRDFDDDSLSDLIENELSELEQEMSDMETDGSPPVICLPGKVLCRDGQLATCNATGTAWLTEDCPDGEICLEDSCVEQVCTPFEISGCVDEYRVERCNDYGTDWIVEPCGVNIRCENNQCVAISCTPGDGHRCFGRDTIERCSPTGDSYTIESCPEDTLCDQDESGAECLPVICNPNELRCDDNKVQFCNALGTKWITAVDCSELGAFCDSGACKPRICSPGVTACSDDNSSVEVCNDTGTSWTVQQRCSDIDPEAQCRAGECLTPCDLASYDRSYQGCEFWAADLDNGGSGSASQTAQYAIVVSNTNPSRTAHVTIYTSSGVASGKLDSASGSTVSFSNITVPPLSLRAFLLPDNHVVATGRGYVAYKLVSDLPVSAYQFNPYTNELVYSNDATLLLPKHALGSSYRMLAIPHLTVESCSCALWICDHNKSQYKEYIAVIGTESGTTINFSYTGNTSGGSTSITLNPFEVYLVGTPDGSDCRGSCSGFSANWETACWRESLDGSLISANKPISVFGATQCTFLPQDQWACDHIEHQLFPIVTWGKNFVATATSKRGHEPDWYRIVASENGTTVNFSPAVNGTSTISLSAGEVYTFTTNSGGTMSNYIITSNKPIMVGQYLSGQDSTGLQGMEQEAGDPAFFLLAPNEQFRKNYVFLIPSTYSHDFVNIVAPPDTQISIDNGAYTLNSNSFTSVGDWRVKVINYLDDGTHKIESSKPIGVYVYGYSTYVSYAYTGGLDLRLINDKE